MSSLDRMQDSTAALIMESAPVAILLQDLRDLLAAFADLRRAGIEDLAAYLDANPTATADLIATIRGVFANRRACLLLGEETLPMSRPSSGAF